MSTMLSIDLIPWERNTSFNRFGDSWILIPLMTFAKKDGQFMSISDLQIRSKIGKSVIEILRNNGCLDGMPESNQMSLFG